MKLPRNILFAAACILPGIALAPYSRAEDGVTNTINGTTVNYTGSYIVGTNGLFNALIITNAGSLITTFYGIVGDAPTANSNSALVIGAGSIWSNASDTYVGYTGSFNTLTIEQSRQRQRGLFRIL
ncbi:MAG: hypothetical protein NTY01_20345 [Verrucomicrobia bacterium]|nr:hypothetical protein [Verrucomicrobiota bacterium]